MVTKGKSAPSNSDIAAAMRGLKFSSLQLGFIKDENSLPYKQQNKRIHAPRWLRASIWMFGAIFVLVALLLFPRRGEPMQVVQENYVTILIVWILLGVLEFYLLIVRDAFTTRRWKLFAKANGLEEFETEEEWFPGNLRKDGSVYQAFRIASKPGRHVWFGIVNGWFDPDHKMPVAASYASDDFENVLFVRVNSKSFKGTATIYGPNHPVIRENLPAMTDSAFQSLCALASKYSVVIGKGAFTVSHAAGVSITSSASLEHTDLSLESRWLVMTGLISGTMATVVEGLVD